ncbi:hypothetical protein PR202_gb13670 [Eleusine coracana subsp. coracana]|uniref:F-box domain-containing protein n=1 Tax=Eleusine coracana subsp. coracana TaxID=191504 RepID=A0AAV5EUB1_ELECO|nr:hypothetical protein PR202_gb13670 [Eleusine coracana subsp. coracana]
MSSSSSSPAGLPDDVLAGVLRRLPARSLATTRRVCKAWRAIIDEHHLLLEFRHVLPNSVHGLFINYGDHRTPHFFARPTSSIPIPRINGRFDFINPENENGRWSTVLDHCNGLVLYWDNQDASSFLVCNPFTHRWNRLPMAARQHAVEAQFFPHVRSGRVEALQGASGSPGPGDDDAAAGAVPVRRRGSDGLGGGPCLGGHGVAAGGLEVPRVLVEDRAVEGAGVWEGRRGGRDGGLAHGPLG